MECVYNWYCIFGGKILWSVCLNVIPLLCCDKTQWNMCMTDIVFFGGKILCSNCVCLNVIPRLCCDKTQWNVYLTDIVFLEGRYYGVIVCVWMSSLSYVVIEHYGMCVWLLLYLFVRVLHTSIVYTGFFNIPDNLHIQDCILLPF